MNIPFVGFSELEQFLEVINKDLPINALAIVEPGSGGGHGVAVNTQQIIVSQVQEREVLYCAITTGRYQSLEGSTDPFENAAQIEKRAESAWQIVEAFLQENKVQIRNALVAAPKDLRLLDGWANCLRYDKASKLFVRK